MKQRRYFQNTLWFTITAFLLTHCGVERRASLRTVSTDSYSDFIRKHIEGELSGEGSLEEAHEEGQLQILAVLDLKNGPGYRYHFLSRKGVWHELYFRTEDIRNVHEEIGSGSGFIRIQGKRYEQKFAIEHFEKVEDTEGKAWGLEKVRNVMYLPTRERGTPDGGLDDLLAGPQLAFAPALAGADALAASDTTTTSTTTTLAAASALYPLTAVPVLNSLPGAAASLYLDFDGHYEAAYGSYTNINTPPFDLDGNTTTFSDAELSAINQIWQYVAEDYVPFNINVTTVVPASFGNGVALRVAIGGTGTWIGYTGGTGAVNCFINAVPNTVFVFSENQGGTLKYIGEIASHEAGHGFGLQHQFSNPTNGTAPIMAGPTNQGRDVWWYGTNTYGSLQDDMAMIARSQNGFGYRADDHANTSGAASPLTIFGNQVSGFGIISNNSDLDYFFFSTGAGQVSFTVSVPASVNNLDPRLEIRDNNDNLIVTADPSNSYTYDASITTNLTPGYYRLVVASHGLYGDVGQYTVSGTIVGTGGTTVNAPSGLTANPVSTTQINLAWTDNASNEMGYVVDCSQDGINWTRMATLAANTTTYADGSASAGTTYLYRVCAQSGSTFSSPSNTASATTVPLAPGSLAATAVSSSQINLSWSDVSGETGYKIERSTDGVTWVQIGTVGANTVSYQSTGLNAGTTYSFRVRAYNGGGNSAYSNTASAATLEATTPPAAPDPLAASGVSSSQINLSWANSSGETGYQVERSSDGVSWSQIANPGAEVTSYQDSGLPAATAFSYRVRAYNSVGNSSYTNIASATTLSLADATPPLVNILSPANGAIVSSTVSISASASDNVGVARVEFYLGSQLLGSDLSSPYSLSFNSSVYANSAYTLTAKAFDAAGNQGANSVSISINNVSSDGEAPLTSILSPISGATVARNKSVTISASASDNVGVARVEFYVNSSLICSDTISPYSCTWKVPGTRNKTYQLQTKAMDAAGNLGASAIVTVTAK